MKKETVISWAGLDSRLTETGAGAGAILKDALDMCGVKEILIADALRAP
jgi:hypothetical protein